MEQVLSDLLRLIPDLTQFWPCATKLLEEVKDEIKDQCVHYAKDVGYRPGVGAGKRSKDLAVPRGPHATRATKRSRVSMVLDSGDEAEDPPMEGPSAAAGQRTREAAKVVLEEDPEAPWSDGVPQNV